MSRSDLQVCSDDVYLPAHLPGGRSHLRLTVADLNGGRRVFVAGTWIAEDLLHGTVDPAHIWVHREHSHRGAVTAGPSYLGVPDTVSVL